jgi:cytochrome c oxidase subunit II
MLSVVNFVIVIFMNLSPSQFLGIPKNFSAHGGQVDHMIDIVHWFMIVLFVGWTVFFFYCIFRFWHKNHPKASYEGVRSHLSSHLEVGVILVEAVLLLGFAFPLWAERVDSWKSVQNLDPVRVRVVGKQFGWIYHYSGLDNKFGRHDPNLITNSNELGIDYSDPNALDDFTESILKIPVDRAAVLNIGTKDVIHNYSIVPMRIQQDAIPGREIPMWFTPTSTLETYVVCAQLCGEGHGNMVGSMEVLPKDQYDSFFKNQSESALKANSPKSASQPTAKN